MASFAYTYDDNKNKLTETLGSPMANYGFDSTTYDNEDRLTAWSRVDDNKDQSWELSAAGDWDSFTEEAAEVERTHNDVHELTAVGETNLTYDAKGNLTTNSNGQTYQWDFDNRLKIAIIGTTQLNMTYDALGRRITKTVVTSGQGGHDQGSSGGITRRTAGGGISRRTASTITTTTLYVPDGQQEVAEYYRVSPNAPSLVRKYVYANYVDEPLLMLGVSGETETKYYNHQNSLYSVAALTNQAGSVVERYSYLAYGAITFHNADGSVAGTQSSTVSNPYLFTGRRLDSETGLMYYRARYYDTNLGRFIGRDPIGTKGGINLYEYVGDSPLISLDPMGLEPILPGPLPEPPKPPKFEPIAGIKCDVSTGKYKLTFFESYKKLGPCAQFVVNSHEAYHWVVQLEDCCTRANRALEIELIHTPWNKRQEVIDRYQEEYDNWMVDNRDLMECDAHRFSADVANIAGSIVCFLDNQHCLDQYDFVNKCCDDLKARARSEETLRDWHCTLSKGKKWKKCPWEWKRQ